MTEELRCLIEQLLEAQWHAALQYELTVDTEVNQYGGDSNATEELWNTYYTLVEDRNEVFQRIAEEVDRIAGREPAGQDQTCSG